METATRNAADGVAATTWPHAGGLGLGEVGGQAEADAAGEHHGRPRQAAGDDAEALVALPFAGGHHAGEVPLTELNQPAAGNG
jgi:hypothetical protein